MNGRYLNQFFQGNVVRTIPQLRTRVSFPFRNIFEWPCLLIGYLARWPAQRHDRVDGHCREHVGAAPALLAAAAAPAALGQRPGQALGVVVRAVRVHVGVEVQGVGGVVVERV